MLAQVNWYLRERGEVRRHMDKNLQAGLSTIWWVLGIFVLIVLVAIPFINNPNNDLSLNNLRNEGVEDIGVLNPEDEPAMTERNAMDETIMQNPDDYIGQQVTFSADVDETYDTRTFSLENPGALEPSLLVLSRNPLQGQGGAPGEGSFIDENSSVQVTGTIRVFNIADFESEYGVDLDDAAYADWEGKTVVVADSVQVIQR